MPSGVVDGRQRALRKPGTGVAVHDVEPSPAGHDIVDKAVDKVRLGDVAGILLGATAVGMDPRDRLLRPIMIKIVYHDVGTPGREQACGCPPDPRTTAGDDRRTAVKTIDHFNQPSPIPRTGPPAANDGTWRAGQSTSHQVDR